MNDLPTPSPHGYQLPQVEELPLAPTPLPQVQKGGEEAIRLERYTTLLLVPVFALWNFWVRPIRAEPLALFRILVGVMLLASELSCLAPNLPRYLGEDGLCPGQSLDPWLKRSNRFTLLRAPVNLPLVQQQFPDALAAWSRAIDNPRVIYALFAIWMVSIALMTVGLFTRLSTLVAWMLCVSFQVRLTWLTNGGDCMFRSALFYLLLSPAGAAWSLDALWRRRPGPVHIAPWSVRLMQIQLCCVYLFTGLIKVTSGWDTDLLEKQGLWAAVQHQDWLNGEAVYWVLNDIQLARWPYCQVPVPLLVCRLLSWGTLLFEIGFPLFILFAWLRPWTLLAGLLLHLGILIHTEVGWFTPAILCWYALFLSGPLLARLTGRVAETSLLAVDAGKDKMVE